jgi:NADH dehydrogenase
MADLATVIGGSGFLGRYIVQELARAGWRVRVACRNPQRAGFLRPLGEVGQIQLIAADLTRPESLDRAAVGAAAVVNLPGILAPSGRQTFKAVHAEGAGHAARAAAAAGARAFVHVSAIGADPASPSAYARSKAAGEARARAAFPAATILRPSLVFGPEDGFLNRFAALARMAPVMPVVEGDSRFQPVWVVDVARAAAMAAREPDRFGGRTFELGGPAVLSFRDILAFVLAQTRRDRALIEVPGFAARLMAAAGDVLPGLPMTSDQLAMLGRDNVVAPGAPGLDAFGIAPTPMEAIAPAYLERYRRFGRFARPGAA